MCGKNMTSGCTAMNTDSAPTSGIIADFMTGDGGLTVAGGLTTYGGTAAPTYIMNSGSVDIMEAAGTTPTVPSTPDSSCSSTTA